MFTQSARFQSSTKSEKYTSVVFLDEVGLAEDSPYMPLKVLHPLLEDGTDGSQDLELPDKSKEAKESVKKDHKVVEDQKEKGESRVAFVGISNWSLDPAKMNRGIMLCRSTPKSEELQKTARYHFSSGKI